MLFPLPKEGLRGGGGDNDDVCVPVQLLQALPYMGEGGHTAHQFCNAFVHIVRPLQHILHFLVFRMLLQIGFQTGIIQGPARGNIAAQAGELRGHKAPFQHLSPV